jgi:hypothetical protein
MSNSYGKIVYGVGDNGYAILSRSEELADVDLSDFISFCKSISWRPDKSRFPDHQLVAVVPSGDFTWVCRLSEDKPDVYGRELTMRIEADLCHGKVGLNEILRSAFVEAGIELKTYPDFSDSPREIQVFNDVGLLSRAADMKVSPPNAAVEKMPKDDTARQQSAEEHGNGRPISHQKQKQKQKQKQGAGGKFIALLVLIAGTLWVGWEYHVEPLQEERNKLKGNNETIKKENQKLEKDLQAVIDLDPNAAAEEFNLDDFVTRFKIKHREIERLRRENGQLLKEYNLIKSNLSPAQLDRLQAIKRLTDLMENLENIDILKQLKAVKDDLTNDKRQRRFNE